jgi:ribonuclease P protein component
MIGRLVQAADFQRLLAAPLRQRSAHFAVHHVSGVPTLPARRQRTTDEADLSTDCEPSCPEPVDELPPGRWLGCVVPKRHARRAVTRSVLKRQIRAAVGRHEDRLAQGLWLVRLRQPFAPMQFPSADSGALRAAVRQELEQLLARLES